MRARAAIAAATCAALALIAGYLLTWTSVSALRESGSDFSASYAAALLVRDGHGASLYDQTLEQTQHLALLPPGTHITLPFVTPPTTALLALPFTVTDVATASRAFSLIQLALLVCAVVLAVHAAPWPRATPRGARGALTAVALAGVPTLGLLLVAQMDAICALGVAAGYRSWRRGEPGAAGFWLALGFALTKPHLAAGLVIFLIARREWRALAGAAAAAASAASLALAVAGPSGITGFAADLWYSLQNTPGASTIGLPGLVASWLSSGPASTAIAVAASAAALAGCAVLGARSRQSPGLLEASLSGALLLSLAASPHLLTYDLVVLAPAFAWSTARLACDDDEVRRPWPGRLTLYALGAWTAANVIVDLDLGNGALAPPGRLVPWALVAGGLVALRLCRPPVPAAGRMGLAQPGSGRAAGGLSA